MLKRAYVTAVRGLRAVSEKAGLLSRLEKRSAKNRTARWLRSLFAIYDIEDMAALDLPWWTFDAIEETDKFLKSRQGAKVFEYGSGASTIWLARRAAFVVSIEHDEGWHAIVSQQLAPYRNVRLELIEPDDEPTAGYISEKKGWQDRSFRRYASAIVEEGTRFDLIVIDGRARGACARRSVNWRPRTSSISVSSTTTSPRRPARS